MLDPLYDLYISTTYTLTSKNYHEPVTASTYIGSAKTVDLNYFDKHTLRIQHVQLGSGIVRHGPSQNKADR